MLLKSSYIVVLFVVLAVLQSSVRALNMDAWKDALKNSIKDQVNSQVQATVNQVVPGIVSQSVNNAINQQLATWTANQPAVNNPAPVVPAPTPPPAVPVQTQQPAANNQAPAANNAPAAAGNAAPAQQNNNPPAAAAPVADQPAPSQQAVAPGGGSSGGGSSEPVANDVVGDNGGGGDTSVDLVVVDGATYNAADVQVSTLADGAIVTIASGRTLTGSIMTLSGNVSRPAGVKTATVADTDLSGNTTVHTTSGLSKQATVGLGVGLGVFGAALIGGIFAYRWWSKRRRQHSRTPSIIISAPIEAKQSTDTNGSRPDTPSQKMSELGGVGKPLAAQLDHTPSTMSRRSPVSPWTPATSATGTTTSSPTQVPNIYEMMGSEPVEMAAAQPAGAEMAGSNPPSEKHSPVADASAETGVGKRDRPFSFVQTPTEAFISEKHKPKQSDLVDVNLQDTRS